jgi:hypothetical protein
MGPLMRALRPLCLVLLAAAAAATSGCHTYKYFDITTQLDSSWSVTSAYTINICSVDVSGADQDSFVLPSDQKCPNRNPTGDFHDMGAFEFSTFADGGSMTFTLTVFQGSQKVQGCEIGKGMVTIPVTSATTIPGTLMVPCTAMDCRSGVPMPGCG